MALCARNAHITVYDVTTWSWVWVNLVNPGQLAIHFTGLRPGEKLNEELLVGDASFGTEHRKIMRTHESHLPWSELRPRLANLERACDTFDFEAIKKFIEGLVDGADLAEQLTELPRRSNMLPVVERTLSAKREQAR